MTSERFDVVVIGGGIHGAGVAQAAAAAGHRTLVLEKASPAAGTSSRSSKLIHGGLRYLETAQFRLVRECLAERHRLLRLAPDLVHMADFYLPVYADSQRPPWMVRAGLGLYSALGGFHRETRFRRLHRREWSSLSGLSTDGLREVFVYRDGQTDDAALTRAVLASAGKLGAEIMAGTEAVAIDLDDDECRIDCRSESGAAMELSARVIVNACGPWAPEVLKRVTPAQPLPAVDLVQGTHLLLPETGLPGMFYVESPRDRRAVFIMPWEGRTLVGTTETVFRGRPDDVRPLPGEIAYLRETLAHYFPGQTALHGDEAPEAFAGLRVLPASDDAAHRRSRETMLPVDRDPRPRLLTILGGKLTSYRATADQVMSRIAPSLPATQSLASTLELPLVRC